MNQEAPNAADENQVRERSTKQRSKRLSELEDINWILGSKQGRRFFWRYLGMCGVFESSFTGNNTTFFKEGERNIGLRLLSDLNESAPNAYALMQKEANEEKQLTNRKQNKEN
jgi:hypothetical protein